MHKFIEESCPAVFKHFRVSLAACVINFHLGHSFYIDINNMKILLFFSQYLEKKERNEHLPFIIHFGKRIEDEWWLGVGLGSCDK